MRTESRTTAAAPSLASSWVAALPALAVGAVFIASALVKLLYDNQGAARFARLGLPAPSALALLVSCVELGADTLLVAGRYVRFAAVPLALDMVVAIAVSKLPLLTGAGPEPLAAAPRAGLWAFVYQARLDVLLLALCVYLALRPESARSNAPAASPATTELA